MKYTERDDRERPRQSIDGFFVRPRPVRPVRIGGEQPRQEKPQYRSYQPSAERQWKRELPAQNRPRQPLHQPETHRRQQLAPEVVNPLTREEMNLPGGEHRSHKHRRGRTFRKWAMRSAGSVVVLILLVAGFLFSKGYLQLHKVFTGGSSAAALNSDVDPNELKGEGSGRVNILLLGVGGPGHDGADLTDTIMIASIDVVNHKVGLLSIPRDLWVKEPNNFMSSYGKINAAYESGKYQYLGRTSDSNANIKSIKAGFQAADATISRVVGIPINYNVLVNFHAFEQAVNAVGGVTINVPEELYDPTMAWENHWNPVLAQKGVQHMNGRHALLYARSRETSSDFARSGRQRDLLLALQNKVLTAGTLSNPLKISNLLSALGNNVRTDISLSDMDRMYNIISGIPSGSIKSVDLDKAPNNFVTTGDINGQSVVEPKAGLFDYGAIQNFVRNTMRDGYLEKENALVTVLNGTDIPGLATNVAATLKSYGYRVAKPTNAPTSGYAKTQIIDLTAGRDKYTLHYLERRFNVDATRKLPAGITANGADFVIILGQDEAASA